MDKCVVYCRVSTPWQTKWWWLPSQRSSCRRHAERSKWKIIKYFEDWWFSWKLLARPWIIELFEFVKSYNKENENDPIKYFLCDDINRLAREVEVHLSLKRKMNVLWIKLKLVNQDFEDTPVGKFVETIMAWHAQLHREKNREQVISRQESRLMDWFWCFFAPVWYYFIPHIAWWKILKVDEKKAKILKAWMEKYANNVFDSLQEVATYWEKSWLEISEKSKKKIHISSVSRIFKNILYTWFIRYQKVTRDKDWVIINEWDIPLTAWKHEWIIDMDLYKKIQDKLWNKAPYQKPKRKTNQLYPLRWFIICSCCKLKLSSWTSKWNKPTDYYTFNKKCKWEWKWGVMPKVLHPQFEELLKNIAVDKRFSKFLKLLIHDEKKVRWKQSMLKSQELKKKIEEIDIKTNNLITELSENDSKVVRKKIIEMVEELEIQKNSAEKALKNMDSSDDTLSKTMDLAFEIMEDPLYFWTHWTVDEKVLLLKLLFRNKLEVHRNTQTFWTIEVAPLFQLNELFLDNHLQGLEVTGVEPVCRRHI